jgi:hypothetical protein
MLAGRVARLHEDAAAARGTALHEDLLHAVRRGVDVLVAEAARAELGPARLADRAAALAAAVDHERAGEVPAVVVEAHVVARRALHGIAELRARRLAEHALQRELQALAAGGRLLDQRRRRGRGDAARARSRRARGECIRTQAADRQARDEHGEAKNGPCASG